MDLNQIKPKPRPDDVPVGNVKRESGAVTESIRPKTIKKRPRDRAKEFGDLEYRADLDTQLSWNPIARLGFDPDIHKIVKPPTAFYAKKAGPGVKEELIKEGYSSEDAEKVKTDRVITGSDLSVSPIIAHEFTHRGFNILRNKMNENPEAFEEKYGKQARRILEFTSKGNLKSDFEEYYVELFDDLDTRFNSASLRAAGYGGEYESFPTEDLRRTVQSSKIGPNYRLGDSSDRYRNARIRQIKTFQDNIEKYRKKGKLSGAAQGITQDINNGILGLMDAAQDILTEQGEPPKAKRKSLSFFEKLGKMVGFNEGGVAMNDQMEMAFMNEGGIADDGMDVDPVSGNEVPPGSLAEEVRDDIPAQLSEGEYVVPADVVRYYGVKFFEDLRDRAKMGLAQMEADGRIGGEPVPDGGPVNDKELSEQEMAAIREVMGMAEGGEVQNPYLQQQQLYSQPRPAPIDEKRNTTITNVNPVENQMPMQSMASGGQVQGYQTGNEVAATPSYAQNTFNPAQYGLGFSFMGQQPQQTTMATTTGTPSTTTPGDTTVVTPVTGESPMMTLYGPNGEIRTFNLPLSEADAAEVARLKELGYTTTKATTPTPTSTSRKDRSKTQVEADPNAWMEKFDYTDMGNLGSQTSELLSKSPMGSVMGAFSNASNAAQAAANIIIMDANGASKEEVAKLKSQYQQFLKDSKLEYMPKGLINGDRLAKDIVENNIDVALFKDSTDPFGNRIFKEGTNDFEKFVQKVGPKGRGAKGIQDTIAATSAPPPRPAPTGTGVSITPPTDTKRKSLDVRKAEAQTRIDAKKRRDKRKKSVTKAKSISKDVKGKGAKAVSATQKAGPFNKGGLMNKKGDK